MVPYINSTATREAAWVPETDGETSSRRHVRGTLATAVTPTTSETPG
jgi:hypothetical protein